MTAPETAFPLSSTVLAALDSAVSSGADRADAHCVGVGVAVAAEAGVEVGVGADPATVAEA